MNYRHSPPLMGNVIKLGLRRLFDVERTSVRLHPIRTEVRATIATLKFLYV